MGDTVATIIAALNRRVVEGSAVRFGCGGFLLLNPAAGTVSRLFDQEVQHVSQNQNRPDEGEREDLTARSVRQNTEQFSPEQLRRPAGASAPAGFSPVAP